MSSERIITYKNENNWKPLDEEIVDRWISRHALVPCEARNEPYRLIEAYLPYTKKEGEISEEELRELIGRAAQYEWKVLDLSCLGLKAIPEELWKLSSLKVLVLGKITSTPSSAANKIKEITFMEDALPDLSVLFLAGLQLNQLPNSASRLKRLQFIDVSFNCKYVSFARIAITLRALNNQEKSVSISPDYGFNIDQLTDFFMQCNTLTKTTVNLEQLNEVFNCLVHNKRANPAFPSTLSRMPLIEREPDKEVKVIVCGPRGLGKTSLIKQLFYHEAPSTQNTGGKSVIEHCSYNYYAEGILYQLNVWEYTAGVHSEDSFPLLFDDHALYIYVWKHDTSDLNNNIKSFLDKCNSNLSATKVLFVNTHDDTKCEDNRGRFEDIIRSCGDDKRSMVEGVYYVGRPYIENKRSDQYDDRINILKNNIIACAKEMSCSFENISPEYMDIKRCIQSIRQPFMRIDSYYKLCESIGLYDKNEAHFIIKHLHKIGVTHYFQSKSLGVETGDIIVFDLNWIVAAFDKIIGYSEKKRMSVIDTKKLYNILDCDSYPDSIHGCILEVMVCCSLAARLIETGDKYVVKNLHFDLFNGEQKKYWQDFLTGGSTRKLERVENYQYVYHNRDSQELFYLLQSYLNDYIVKDGRANRFACSEEVGVSHGAASAKITLNRDKRNSIDIEIYAPSNNTEQFKDLAVLVFSKITDMHNMFEKESSIKIEWALKIRCVGVHRWQDTCEIIGKHPCSWDYRFVRCGLNNRFMPTCQFPACPISNPEINDLHRGLKEYENMR